MLPFVLVPALMWISLTVLLVAACQAARSGDRSLAEAPRESDAPLSVDACTTRRSGRERKAPPLHDAATGRLLARAVCRRAGDPAPRGSYAGAARHLARGAVTAPPLQCPAHGDRWGHVRGDERPRSPLAPRHTLARASACGRRPC